MEYGRGEKLMSQPVPQARHERRGYTEARVERQLPWRKNAVVITNPSKVWIFRTKSSSLCLVDSSLSKAFWWA